MYACLLWNLYTHTNDRLCGSESWKSLNSGKEIYIVKTFDDIKCIYGPYAFFQIFQSPTADSKENNIIKHVLLCGLKPAIVVRSFQNLSNFLQLRTCRESYCLLPASANSVSFRECARVIVVHFRIFRLFDEVVFVPTQSPPVACYYSQTKWRSMGLNQPNLYGI